MTELHLRAMTTEERAQMFFAAKPTFDIDSYKLAVKRMQPGVGYAISINGTSPRATRLRFNKAAKAMGRKLTWAGGTKPDVKEIYVELHA